MKRKSHDIYEIIGKAVLGYAVTVEEHKWLVDVARETTNVVYSPEIAAILADRLPSVTDAAANTVWNVKIPVVEVVQERTAADAVRRVITGLKRSGFSMDYAEDCFDAIVADAFVSDESYGLGVVEAALNREESGG